MIPSFLLNDTTIKALYNLILSEYVKLNENVEEDFQTNTFLQYATNDNINVWKNIYGVKAETNASLDNTKAVIRTKNLAINTLNEESLKLIAKLYTNNEIEVYHGGSNNNMIDYIIVNDRKVILVGGGVDTTQLADRSVNVYFAHSNPQYLWWWNIMPDESSRLEEVPNTGQKVKRLIIRENNIPYEISVVESGTDAALHAEAIPQVNVPANTILIKFVGKYGVPDNINNFRSIMRDIIPAHLEITYEYMYTTWNQVDGKNHTWDSVDAKNVTWNQVDQGGLL